MKKVVLGFCLAALVGCASLAPNPPVPDTQIPKHFNGGGKGSVVLKWKDLFVNPSIQDDINLSLRTNQDLQKATLVALRAKQLINTVQGPVVASASANGVFTGPLEDCCVSKDLTYGLVGMTFDVDIWGRIASATNAAEFNAVAAGLSAEDIQNIISSEVIRAHLIIAYTNEYQTVLDKMDAILSMLEKKAKSRTAEGLPNSIDLSRVLLKKNDVLTVRTQVLQQRFTAIESLRLLTSYAQSNRTFANSISEVKPTTYTIPKDTPSATLLGRPDLRAAYNKMLSDNALIGVAAADRLPQVSIPFNLLFFSDGKSIWEVLPTISQILFDGGRLKAIEDVAITTRDISEKEYVVAVQKSFMDVVNGIANADTMEKQVTSTDRSKVLAAEAFDRTLARNQAGYETLGDVIDRFNDLFTASAQATKAKFDRASVALSLFASLGAGV